MDRRQFLKYSGFFTVSVASTTLTACGGSTSSAVSLNSAIIGMALSSDGNMNRPGF